MGQTLEKMGSCAGKDMSVDDAVVAKNSMEVSTVFVKPIEGQKPGTSGLRKKTKVHHSQSAAPPLATNDNDPLCPRRCSWKIHTCRTSCSQSLTPSLPRASR